MEANITKELIHFLYEGRSLCPQDALSHEVVFQDPLVLVEGNQPVEAMFMRINKLFPATEIVSLVQDPYAEHYNTWNMTVDYKRKPDGFTRTIESVLELDLKDDKVVRMTEHWLKPVKLRGDKKNVLGKMFRKRLGGLLGR